MKKFQAYRVFPKTDADIMAMKMKQGENVTQFAKRFWAVYSQIENSKDEVAVFAFQNALLPDSDLRKDLARNPVSSIAALMAIANRYIAQEDDQARARENHGTAQKDRGERPSKKDGGPSRRDEPRRDERRRGELDRRWAPTSSARSQVFASERSKRPRLSEDAYRAVNTVFKMPIHRIMYKIQGRPYFRWPDPMQGDPSTRDQTKFCSYHREGGHKTEECRILRSHLEKLVQDGHLQEFVRREARADTRVPRRDEGGHDSDGSEKIINVIHLAPPPKGSNQARAEARQASHSRQVMAAELSLAAKRARRERPEIRFTDKDLEGVQLPHNDPLTITLRFDCSKQGVKNCTVKKILVDPGSATEVLYFDSFRRMGLT